MQLLDLFAGIGGFSLAAHWMGWQTVAFVEKDKFCQRVLRKNFGPDIEIYDDIFQFDGTSFRGSVDIITGGFPCQPFSAAGKRKGRTDERHLFPEMLRVIREVKPRWVVAENVRGLLSIESGSVFAEVVASLEGEGYEVITFCVPASAVEAPHRRDRLWIVGSRSNGSNTSRNPQGTGTAAVKAIFRGSRPRADSKRSDVITHTECGRSAIGEQFENGTGCADRDASNSGDERLPRSRGGSQSEGSFVIASNGHREETFTDTGNPRLQRGEFTRTSGEGTGPSRSASECSGDASGWSEPWIEAATRFCRMDDVVPNRVDRLKSLGNSVVPLIPFEIFKAIEQQPPIKKGK